MADLKKLMHTWSEAAKFLDGKYSRAKEYVDNEIDPNFVVDDNAVSTKVVPEDCATGMIAKISGRTQKVVQILEKGNFPDNSGWETINVSKTVADNTAKVTVTTAAKGSCILYKPITFLQNHKYVVFCDVKKNSSTAIKVGFRSTTTMTDLNVNNVWTKMSVISTSDVSSSIGFIAYFADLPNAGDTFEIKNVQVFDLTAMYGAGNEPTLEQCREIFTTYIPYTTGSIFNTPIEKIVVTGKNKLHSTTNGYLNANGTYQSSADWNGDEEYIPYNPNMVLTATGSGDVRFALYDANKNPLSADCRVSISAVPYYLKNNASFANAKFIRVCWVNTRTNVQLETNATPTPYTPYNKTTVSVPSEIQNNVGYGLGYNTEDCNIVDLENGKYYYNVDKKAIKDCTAIEMPLAGLFFIQDVTPVVKMLSSKYTFVDVAANSNAEANSLLKDKEMTYRHGTNDRIYFKDSSSSTLDAFKTNNADVEFLYVLPTNMKKVIDISDIIRPIKVEQGGTVTLVSPHNLDTPNTIKYKKEVK